MKEMSWRNVLADRSCGDPRAYRSIQARIDKTSLRPADYVKSLCSTSEFGFNITSAHLGKRCCLGRVSFTVLVAVTCVILANSASAQLGASEEQLGRLLGNPVKKSGDLIYYHKSPRNLVAHMYHGACDQICIFSDKETQGFPIGLTDDEIQNLLRDFGGGMDWFPVGRLSMNRVWNSRDGRSFAIYETMHNKLVMMTRDAYRREKHAQPQEKGM